MKSFIVERSSQLFKALGFISILQIIRCIVGKRFSDTGAHRLVESYGFVDIWVVGQCALSFVLALVCSAPNVRRWEWIAIIFGIAFVCETVIYQINVTLFNQYRERKEEIGNKRRGTTPSGVRSYRRIVILLFLNYIEIAFWFALFYRNMGQAFETYKASLNSFPTALHFSLVTMTGFGNSSISPTNTLSYIVTSIHMAIGLIMVILILTTFISLIPKPKTLDEFER